MLAFLKRSPAALATSEKALTKAPDAAEKGWLKSSLPGERSSSSAGLIVAAQHKTAQRVAFRLLWVLLLLVATVFIIIRASLEPAIRADLRSLRRACYAAPPRTDTAGMLGPAVVHLGPLR